MNDLDRAIAIIEDSRQTHVRWAAWRQKGNGTDTDHELIGDLEWHENAIRGYDHVLSVLRARGGPSVIDVERLADAYHRYRTQYPGGTIFCGDEHGPFEFDSAVCNCRMDMEGTLRLAPEPSTRTPGEDR